jgi:hypothetical protein
MPHAFEALEELKAFMPRCQLQPVSPFSRIIFQKYTCHGRPKVQSESMMSFRSKGCPVSL